MTNKRIQSLLQRSSEEKKKIEPFSSGYLSSGYLSSGSDHTGIHIDQDDLSIGSSELSSKSFRPSNKYVVTPDVDLIKSSHERIKEEKIKQSLTATTLQFDRVGLCGRVEEIKTLKGCLNRVVQATSSKSGGNQREFILLGGHSGSGKSALALELQQPVENQHHGVFGTGKYEFIKKDIPMLGLVGAAHQICQKILELQESNLPLFEIIQMDLKEKTDDTKLGLLSCMIPTLPMILQTSGKNNKNKNGGGEEEVNQIQTTCSAEEHHQHMSLGCDTQKKVEIAFRLFFRVLCTHLSPLVLMLDDLQWCADFSIINILLNDSENSGLIIIGCYRSNEVEPDGALSKTILHLRAQPSEGLSFTEINVGNLSLENTRHWFSELLSKDIQEVEELASLCHSRTQGNIFFMKSFLSLLVEDGFMKFHIGSFTWDWNIQAIREGTSIAPNLVGIIQNRMAKLHESAGRLMTVASCLGASFGQDTLWLVWWKTQQHEGSEEVASLLFETILELVVQANCLETANTNETESGGKSSTTTPIMYRFSHDKIQEAAMSLIPMEEYKNLQYTVGQVLFEELCPGDRDPMMYLITDLLNVKSPKCTKLAEMNLNAALVTKSIAAFTCTAKYVRYGIQCLPDGDSMWDSQHLDLAIKLHSLGAVAELNLANMEAAEEYCTAVIDQDKATPLQRCTAYHVKVLLCHHSSEFEKGLELCLQYLAELGCKFSKNKLVRKVQSAAYIKETRTKYIPTLEEVQQLPIMTDPTKVEARYLLEEAGSTAYMLKDTDLYILIRCRYVRWIKKYGLTPDAANAFGSFANILTHIYGDFDTGKTVAQLCIAMQQMSKDKYAEARTVGGIHHHVFGWIQPLRSQLQIFLSCYQSGMKSGNVFSACTDLCYYLFASFQSGTKLSLLQEDCQNYIPLLDRLHMFVALDFARPVWQVVENLLGGNSDNTTQLTGSIMEEDEFKKSCRVNSLAIFSVHKCLACVYFGDFETATKIVLDVDPDVIRKDYPGLGFGFEYLPFGLSLFAMSRKTQQSKYKRPALQIRNDLEKLVGKGCVNLVHHLSLLNAECYALHKKTEKARDSYSKAATEAARGGFLQDAGLANERYADYLLEMGDDREATYYLKEAIKYYEEWGATKKVNLLLEEHRELLQSTGVQRVE